MSDQSDSEGVQEKNGVQVKKWISRGIQATVWIMAVLAVLVIIQEWGAYKDYDVSRKRLSEAFDSSDGLLVENIEKMLQGDYEEKSKNAGGAEYTWKSKFKIKSYHIKLRFGVDGIVKEVSFQEKLSKE